ncbi:hypothetical protein CcaverHIS002_0210100 [Cutaneotrichosporon cavernicola]|nr:hypothetical protein CcaverHIS002_0210100 [Cutaneotrichosporon cavernicola]BEI97421.1 hypothetical protein CcaverHIS631_0210100 [Cutaneotrichosporon cavernicola]BEJ05199.1 hypothetical protein CcaverHIS641_0210160 [Cutaneotrichosporon cavernicola]
MHALEGKPNTKRKTSEPTVGVQRAPPKANRSDTQLPRLGDSPGSSGIVTKKRGSKAEIEVEVIAGPDNGGDDEWESGEDTPAGSSRPRRDAPAPAPSNLDPVSERRPMVDSASDLPAPSPGHEPRETQLTKGFPGLALPPPSLPSGTASRSHSPSRAASVLSLSRPTSHINLRLPIHTPSTGPVSESAVEGREFPFSSNGPEQRDHRDHREREVKKPSPLKSTHHRQASGSVPQTAPLLRRPPSHASLRSVQSLRAPPHPLNALDSPKQKREVSLHYPPAAPALVNRETVEGQGWEGDGDGAAPPAIARPEPRPARVGSFSSVRSLKDLLNGPAPPRPPPTPRRLTAMQAATAVSRLGTTSDPVAYHQSLGFSATTAETAHLLSRFLPPKRKGRPRWAITAREALAAHYALEAGEEIEPGRVGLTDGQYRDSHESLVATLRSLGARKPRRGTSRSISYQSLLGATEEVAWSPRRQGSGMSPFEMSAARCLTQRPRA